MNYFYRCRLCVYGYINYLVVNSYGFIQLPELSKDGLCFRCVGD